MKKEIRRFWFEFSDSPKYSPLGLGCGISAYDQSDAVEILKKNIFSVKGELSISKCIEDVDMSLLDGKHVLPNIGSPLVRGIWFPMGF